MKSYTERPKTAYEHAWEIEQAFGYHKYDDQAWGRKFRTFLYGRAWTHAEGPVALFNHATAWLRRHRVLLPGVSILPGLATVHQATEALSSPRRRG
ncbi:MAG: transposase [Amycolatopsis sp.]|nr:transposase [Amycolatopsis sp.]